MREDRRNVGTCRYLGSLIRLAPGGVAHVTYLTDSVRGPSFFGCRLPRGFSSAGRTCIGSRASA
jgi:hypothetical protein